MDMRAMTEHLDISTDGVELSNDDIKALEEVYEPHAIAGHA